MKNTNNKPIKVKENNFWNADDTLALEPLSSSEFDSLIFILRVYKETQAIESSDWIKLRDALKDELIKNGLDPKTKMEGLF